MRGPRPFCLFLIVILALTPLVQSFWFGRAWRVIDAVAWPGPRTLLQGLWIVAALVVLAAASSHTAFCGWAVTPATTSCCWPSAASGGGFVRRVPGGAWRRRRPTWLSRSFPGCRHANGSSRCPFPCGIGWPPRRTSPRRSIRSSVPRSGSIM
jgi:hypothetical protein